MSTRALLVLVLCFAAISALPSNGKVKRQATLEFGNKRYYLESLIKANFHNAYMFCRRMGMQLLTIDTNEEYDYLHKLITSELSFGPDSKLWTSGTDIAREGKFNWLSTGNPIRINKWLPGEPDNDDGEHCLQFWNRHGNIGLNDDKCHTENYFICEKKKN